MSSKLDGLVAERVMGYVFGDVPMTELDVPRPRPLWIGQPKPYSSDISAAWEVVEKMRANGWFFSLGDSVELPEWIARFTICPAIGQPIPDFSHLHESAPVAVAVAALRACGVPEAEIQEAMTP